LNLQSLKSIDAEPFDRQAALQLLGRLQVPSLKDENFRFTSLPNLASYLTSEPGANVAASNLSTDVLDYPEAFTDKAQSRLSSWDPQLAQEWGDKFRNLAFWQNDYLAAWADAHARQSSGIDSSDGESRRSLEFFEGTRGLFSRRQVRVRAGESMKWIEIMLGASQEAGGLIVGVTQILVEESGSLDWIQIQDWPEQAEHYGRYLIILEKNASLKYRAIHRGGRKGQNLIRTDSAEGARIDLEAAIHLDGRRQFDYWVDNYHDAEKTQTNVRVNSIATDQAKIIFNANLKLSSKAKGTEARQKSRSFLLSPRASIEVMPKLEIAIDDVKVSHGASVSNLDENQIFYLRSRGLSEEQAKSLLIEAFMLPTLRALGSNDEARYWAHRLNISSAEETDLWK